MAHKWINAFRGRGRTGMLIGMFSDAGSGCPVQVSLLMLLMSRNMRVYFKSCFARTSAPSFVRFARQASVPKQPDEVNIYRIALTLTLNDMAHSPMKNFSRVALGRGILLC